VDEFAVPDDAATFGEWAAANGFAVERTTIELRGKCRDCQGGAGD
jgi:Fur family transcriptional regulator, zinc uptake regulator